MLVLNPYRCAIIILQPKNNTYGFIVKSQKERIQVTTNSVPLLIPNVNIIYDTLKVLQLTPLVFN